MAQHTPQQYSVPIAAEDFKCGVGGPKRVRFDVICPASFSLFPVRMSVAAGSHEGEVEGLLGMGPPASTRSERKRLQSEQVRCVHGSRVENNEEKHVASDDCTYCCQESRFF